MIERIALGTAQFGMAYGINNSAGKVRQAEVGRILDFAMTNGVTTIDTAAAYGNSEQVLGQCMKTHTSTFVIVSKFDSSQGLNAEKAFERSTAKLGVNSLHGYLLHNFSEYLASNGRVWEELTELRRARKVAHTGFSLYHPSELELLREKKIDFDLIQFPYSVLDRRFQDSLASLKESGVEIHVRSVFLQGLVFSDVSKLPRFFDALLPRLRKLRSFSEKTGVSIAGLCMGMVLQNALVDRAVLGVDSLEDLAANVRCAKEAASANVDWEQVNDIACSDERLILPINWQL